jgi:basic membrane protein A
MKKTLLLMTILVMVVSLVAGCAAPAAQPSASAPAVSAPSDSQPADQPSEPAKQPLKIGLIYSLGGRGDGGINDMMYNAMEEVCKENGWSYSDLENETASNVEPANRQFCEQGMNVIINFGFGCIDVVNKLAVEYPEIKFITLDAVTDPLPNVANYTFKEWEGSYLVGVAAGMMTKTNKVGFLGGMENDMIKGFNAGYIQGVHAVNPNCEVMSAYCGSTVEAFGDPTKGKEIAISFYDAGADIVYAAAGGSGKGMFEAAIEKGKWAIGVDVNQQSEAPDNILTSMLKRCDSAIKDALLGIANGNFKAGAIVLGAKEDGVGYVNDATNAGKLSPEVIAKVDEYLAKIKSGEIVVSNKLEDVK